MYHVADAYHEVPPNTGSSNMGRALEVAPMSYPVRTRQFVQAIRISKKMATINSYFIAPVQQVTVTKERNV